MEEILKQYTGETTQLETASNFTIIKKPEKKKEDVLYIRQMLNISIFFLVVFFLIIILFKMYTYDFTTISMAGLNSFTLCNNIPEESY